MRTVRLAIPLAVVLVTSGWLIGQDKGGGKFRGQLPQNWGKLGLSDEQKQKIYEVQTRTRERIDELNKQIRELKETERKDMEAVLTEEQKNLLRKILLDKAPTEKK